MLLATAKPAAAAALGSSANDEPEAVEPLSAGAMHSNHAVSARRDERVPVVVVMSAHRSTGNQKAKK